MTLKELERLKNAGLIRSYTYCEVVANPKKPKFGNIKTKIDDIVFSSHREAKRYIELRYMLNYGKIKGLKLQVPFELNEGGTHSLKYVADFVYADSLTGELIIEDSKGFKTKEYKKKKKLMEKVYGIIVKET